MQYIELREQLKGLTIFSLADIRRIEPGFHRRRLNEWQKKGYIIKIIKSFYIFSGLKINENAIFEIANEIYPPSYVSFEMALSYYGLIPESVYGITCASSRRTYRFKTKIAEFSYRTIKPRLFFGYDIIQHDGGRYKLAAAEKALLDYFYIHPEINTGEDFEKLRINKEIFLNVVSKNRLLAYLRRINQKRLTKRVKNFLEFIKHA